MWIKHEDKLLNLSKAMIIDKRDDMPSIRVLFNHPSCVQLDYDSLRIRDAAFDEMTRGLGNYVD